MGVSSFPQQKPSTKKTSFTTTSSTYVTALSITGSGKLLYVRISQTAGTLFYRITIDGTVYYTSPSTSSSQGYVVFVDGSLYNATNIFTNISFENSLLLEVQSDGTNTNGFSIIVYES